MVASRNSTQQASQNQRADDVRAARKQVYCKLMTFELFIFAEKTELSLIHEMEKKEGLK